MRVVTIVSLGASAVLGLGALFVAKTVLPNSASAKVAPPQAAGAPVVVASRAIKYGDRLEPAMLTVIKVPTDAVPEGSFTSVAQVLAADRGGAPVALTTISTREAILPTKVSGPGSRPSVAAEITDGMRAYTVRVSDVTGVGGHALPGDHVDVVLMRDVTPPGQAQRAYVSQLVLQNVRVLGVDLNADLSSDKPATPSTATLEVSVEDAQKLSMVSNLGTLSLALRKTGAAGIEMAPALRTSDFIAGARPTATRAVYQGSRPNYSAILIVEGSPAKRPPPVRTSAAPASNPASAASTTAATQPAAAGLGVIG